MALVRTMTNKEIHCLAQALRPTVFLAGEYLWHQSEQVLVLLGGYVATPSPEAARIPFSDLCIPGPPPGVRLQ